MKDYTDTNIWLKNGDSLERLKELADNSIDSMITDPPAGISFMGKNWDDDKGGRNEWIEWLSNIFVKVKRVLKPGGNALVWALPRTSHWTATALENSGFEIRDVVIHIFGSGFPKSHNIGKAIDKLNKVEPIDLGEHPTISGKGNKFVDYLPHGERTGKAVKGARLTKPNTEDAKKWAGWGTALKPATEHWILCRLPIETNTIAEQVLATGTGGLNIDACRIGCLDKTPFPVGEYGDSNFRNTERTEDINKQGRFPANFVLSCSCDAGHGENKIKTRNAKQYKNKKNLDTQNQGWGFKRVERRGGDIEDLNTAHQPDCVCALLDEQSGNKCDQAGAVTGKEPNHFNKTPTTYGDFSMTEGKAATPKDGLAGASRFFYQAKVSTRERNAGLELEPNKIIKGRDDIQDKKDVPFKKRPTPTKNIHPTVKSIALMTYLIKLITPPQGIVLDPFMGSGSTGCAAIKEGFKFIGIECEKQYYKIACKRIAFYRGKQ